ncbi:hypothetical protein MTO96_013943 [Rhipicephalus appendiculatus]
MIYFSAALPLSYVRRHAQTLSHLYRASRPRCKNATTRSEVSRRARLVVTARSSRDERRQPGRLEIRVTTGDSRTAVDPWEPRACVQYNAPPPIFTLYTAQRKPPRRACAQEAEVTGGVDSAMCETLEASISTTE